MSMNIHTVTDCVASRYTRAEASFVRYHSGDAPEPLQPLRPMWMEVVEAVMQGFGLASFIAVCVWFL